MFFLIDPLTQFDKNSEEFLGEKMVFKRKEGGNSTDRIRVGSGLRAENLAEWLGSGPQSEVSGGFCVV